MRIRSFYFVVALFTVLVTSSCGSFDNSQVSMNEEFYLTVGQHAFIAAENLQIKFKEVIEDSRCPRNVTCVWAGRVTCAIELMQAGVSKQILLTKPGLEDKYSKERAEGYELTFQVTPYPEAGKKIPTNKYRLHLIISKLSEPTRIIGTILAEPFAFEGRNITVVGYYRGWDLLQEANTAPPVTRSDWVIKDATGAIYVSANSKAQVPEELHPGSLLNTNIILHVKGVVRVAKSGQPYIEATSIERSN